MPIFLQKKRARYDVIICVILFVIDRMIKSWAVHSLAASPSYEVIRCNSVDFFLTYATNRGAAWGIFSEYGQALFVIRILFILGLSCIYRFALLDRMIATGLILIIVGAFSNIIDTVVYGHVVDMFHICCSSYDFPIFNVADVAITAGAAVALVASLCSIDSTK